jgi:hypothetical protein
MGGRIGGGWKRCRAPQNFERLAEMFDDGDHEPRESNSRRQPVSSDDTE